MTATSYWDVLGPVGDSVSIYDGPERFLREFAVLSAKEAPLLAAHWCQSEVCNGGFEQFFGNSAGVLAPEAVAAFVSIGMPETSAVVARAMAWFDTPYPRERSTRNKALSTLGADSPFDALDTDFYQLLGTENGGFESAANSFAGA
jgi:hypothetical protein